MHMKIIAGVVAAVLSSTAAYAACCCCDKDKMAMEHKAPPPAPQK